MRCMELLLEAGCRPAVYTDVWVASQDEGGWELPIHTPSLAPLEDRPQWFSLAGKGRCVAAGLHS